MPLVSAGTIGPARHDSLRAIGLWMTVNGASPIQPVRIFVAYEALSDLDLKNIRDLQGAFDNFEKFQARILAAASEKFDRGALSPDKYEGMPTVWLTTKDTI